MEEMVGAIDHARNVWDRTVTIHPRVDVYW